MPPQTQFQTDLAEIREEQHEQRADLHALDVRVTKAETIQDQLVAQFERVGEKQDRTLDVLGELKGSLGDASKTIATQKKMFWIVVTALVGALIKHFAGL